jgi:DNA-binding transcriptional ArsR family regulator
MIWHVNSSAPALLPIFRSPSQARILAWLLLQPDREQPIASLTDVAEVSQPNVLREVNRLVDAGLLIDRRAGNTRLVRARTSSPYFEPLVAILTRSFGPAVRVPQVLEEVDGVEQVILIGSWAERFTGKPGPPPRDVDVVVVGEPDRRELRAANRRLEEELSQPVQLTSVTAAEWDEASSGFTKTARSRPHVVVLDRTRRGAVEATEEDDT